MCHHTQPGSLVYNKASAAPQARQGSPPPPRAGVPLGGDTQPSAYLLLRPRFGLRGSHPGWATLAVHLGQSVGALAVRTGEGGSQSKVLVDRGVWCIGAWVLHWCMWMLVLKACKISCGQQLGVVRVSASQHLAHSRYPGLHAVGSPPLHGCWALGGRGGQRQPGAEQVLPRQGTAGHLSHPWPAMQRAEPTSHPQ
jgi:hypothetical protein